MYILSLKPRQMRSDDLKCLRGMSGCKTRHSPGAAMAAVVSIRPAPTAPAILTAPAAAALPDKSAPALNIPLAHDDDPSPAR